MDCTSIADRVAPYLDQELSRTERELFEAHLEGCTECQKLVERVAAVDLSPPPPRSEVSEPGFWDRMDVALAAEMSRPVAPPAARRGLGARLAGWELRVSLPVVLAYAAFLTLAVGWAMISLQRAQTAEDALLNMQNIVQREQRQHQEAVTPAVRADKVQTVATPPRSSAPSRGTF